MVAGVPYVATRVGSVEEITPAGVKAHLQNQGDVQGMARALGRVLALSPNERHALQDEMRLWVGRYDLRHVVERFRAIVRDRFTRSG